jgi:hypothetical protein
VCRCRRRWLDDLWHEFILYTRNYQQFCDQAFGRFLHHTPAVVLGSVKTDNEGLRRVWWYCCREENIDPRKATRLPLLFAIDRKLGIGDGFVYELDCTSRPQRDGASTHCADDMSSTSYDGGTDGFGDGAGSGSTGGDSGGDGGCSGGCGGGGGLTDHAGYGTDPAAADRYCRHLPEVRAWFFSSSRASRARRWKQLEASSSSVAGGGAGAGTRAPSRERARELASERERAGSAAGGGTAQADGGAGELHTSAHSLQVRELDGTGGFGRPA